MPYTPIIDIVDLEYGYSVYRFCWIAEFIFNMKGLMDYTSVLKDLVVLYSHCFILRDQITKIVEENNETGYRVLEKYASHVFLRSPLISLCAMIIGLICALQVSMVLVMIIGNNQILFILELSMTYKYLLAHRPIFK